MSIDYCVIDKTTQTVLKNTTREPERLRTGEVAGYEYYLLIDYDSNGRIADIKVEGSNVEAFLKNADTDCQCQARHTSFLCR